MSTTSSESAKSGVATFGGGCFWCVETAFSRLPGVAKAVSGYMGGKIPNPSYRDVCTGTTGHAEVVQLTFDPKAVTYEDLLELFWKIHDPTSLNRQGADIGTQYRSVIFVHSPAQRDLALKSKNALTDSGVFARPVVTEISSAGEFFPAEDYHQDYYRRNPQAGYCQYVIRPKLEKLGIE